MAWVRQVRNVVMTTPAGADPTSPRSHAGFCRWACAAPPTETRRRGQAVTLTPARSLSRFGLKLNRGSTATAAIPERSSAESELRVESARHASQHRRRGGSPAEPRGAKTFDAANPLTTAASSPTPRICLPASILALDPARSAVYASFAESGMQAAPRHPTGFGGGEAWRQGTAPSRKPIRSTPPDRSRHARAADTPAQTPEIDGAMRQAVQELRADGLNVQREAQAKGQRRPDRRAIDLLKGYLATLDEQQLDPAQLTLLRRPVESRLQKFKSSRFRKTCAADSGDRTPQPSTPRTS